MQPISWHTSVARPGCAERGNTIGMVTTPHKPWAAAARGTAGCCFVLETWENRDMKYPVLSTLSGIDTNVKIVISRYLWSSVEPRSLLLHSACRDQMLQQEHEMSPGSIQS